MLTRRTASLYRTLRFAVAALLLLPLLGAGGAGASGAAKRMISTEKDEFIVVGEVFYIGSANDWALFDPDVDPPTNLLADGSPATDPAREHLDNVGIDLGTVARAQAMTDGTTTAGGITEHSVSWLVVAVGELVISDFYTAVEMATGEADSGPYGENVINESCLGYYPCDWFWGQAIDALSIYPTSTTLELDSD
ncbi:MAG: hypothetical protein VCB42_08685, partial [Myxococcota bacterium]